MGYILITGGQLFNKGAQAMTFTVVNEVRNRYSDKEIVLLSSVGAKRSEEDNQRYSFKIFHYGLSDKILMAGGLYRVLYQLYKRGKSPENINADQLKKYFSDAEMIIDVSGYGLSSQWGFRRSLSYLLNVVLASKFSVQIFLMPQSFGPFKYENVVERFWLKRLMYRYLPYPKQIYAREKDGYEALLEYTKGNLSQGLDLILQYRDKINPENIFSDSALYATRSPSIPDGAVCVIPNEKIIRYGEEEQIFKIYRAMVERLLAAGRTVYLLHHSTEDFSICRRIKEMFTEVEQVVLIEEEYNCIELEEILAKFDFVIASRYHSIIHSYRQYIPALVLGWAVKYQALLEAFSQEQFNFLVQEELHIDSIMESLDEMMRSHTIHSETIKERLEQVEQQVVFDQIFS